MKPEVAVFWFRRDLRLEDNCALFYALNSKLPVLPVFIFDTEILSELPKNDPRVQFIHQTLHSINTELLKIQSSILVLHQQVLNAWEYILATYQVKEVYYNADYEPYAIQRDTQISDLCKKNDVQVFSFKDQVIFEKSEILKENNQPYTVYTPYKNKWLLKYHQTTQHQFPSQNILQNTLKEIFSFPSLALLGFEQSNIQVLPINSNCIQNYHLNRDIPSKETSNLSVHLRFGTVSVRSLVLAAVKENSTFLSELIWREFFMQILYHFPNVINENFKPKYSFIKWRNNEAEFKLWCNGETGYPIVDAGMRQLNKTGYMHNRVRMIVASFLTKHLLIDWRWGEAYFAEKLLDYELSSNNGNWQWVAGTGCDAAPYFRVFNPTAQQEKFDPDFVYIKKWHPTYLTNPIAPIVEHTFARNRYLDTMKKSLV
jgi:deoxyribodipyrimidine photo-lyase